MVSAVVAAVVALSASSPPLHAQSRSGTIGATPAEPAPSASATRRAAIRFVTDSDYPPFNYVDEDGQLTGFNVDVARAICLELSATCDIQQRPWNEIIATVKRGNADAAIASHATDARILRDVDISDRYYATPARFVGQRGLLHQAGQGFANERPLTRATRAGADLEVHALATGAGG